jgi:serine/threonine protein kinase
MAQLLLAVDLMHRKSIIHRDLKPENILILDSKNLKVCISDLGLACSVNNKSECSLKCGTPGYVAPEVLSDIPFTPKSDIFSLGCILFNILTGKQLFSGKTPKQLLLENKTRNPVPYINSYI